MGCHGFVHYDSSKYNILTVLYAYELYHDHSPLLVSPVDVSSDKSFQELLAVTTTQEFGMHFPLQLVQDKCLGLIEQVLERN